MTDLHFSSLGALVSGAPCDVFYATNHQAWCKFYTGNMAFASTLIWYHKQTITKTAHRNWYINIY